jgi:hypothetical protein
MIKQMVIIIKAYHSCKLTYLLTPWSRVLPEKLTYMHMHILLSRLTPYAEEIIGDHQYGI